MPTDHKSTVLARKIENSKDIHRKKRREREAQLGKHQSRLGGFLSRMEFLEVLRR